MSSPRSSGSSSTGEPRHNSHDDGQWLQEEVDRAFEQNDAELLRLAKRAAQPLVVSLSSVISSTRSLPWLSVQALPVLAVRGGGKYQADIMVSVDGGEAVRLAMPPADTNAGPLDELLPRQASIPGRHTLRFTAQLTFADQTLGVETREIPEVVYGIYQADSVEAASVRSFINAARNAIVRELDPSLPRRHSAHGCRRSRRRLRTRTSNRRTNTPGKSTTVTNGWERSVPTRRSAICARSPIWV